MVSLGIKFIDTVDGTISKLRRALRYKINLENSMIFLCTSNKNGNKIQLFKNKENI